ncbi:hypothetical protein SEA_SISKO_13 [Gordonia phage Sisko]|nr:hypothetical protein SEA_SISKO_13 [Gordonia phage Sisko]
MPEGIIAEIDEGFATLDFVDRSLRGPALQKLIEIDGGASIEVQTRSGPRKKYRVPEGNAREAGLLDEALPAPPTGNPGDPNKSDPAPEYPEGEPSADWKFDQLKAYAAAHNVDTDGLRSKVDVLAAINTAPVSAPVEQTADADPAQAEVTDVVDTGDGFDIPVTSDDDDKDAS